MSLGYVKSQSFGSLKKIIIAPLRLWLVEANLHNGYCLLSEECQTNIMNMKSKEKSFLRIEILSVSYRFCFRLGFPEDNPFWVRLNRRGISPHIKRYFRCIFAARRDIREAALSEVYQTFAAAEAPTAAAADAPDAPPAKKKTKR